MVKNGKIDDSLDDVLEERSKLPVPSIRKVLTILGWCCYIKEKKTASRLAKTSDRPADMLMLEIAPPEGVAVAVVPGKLPEAVTEVLPAVTVTIEVMSESTLSERGIREPAEFDVEDDDEGVDEPASDVDDDVDVEMEEREEASVPDKEADKST